jgi:hypothetical protein
LITLKSGRSAWQVFKTNYSWGVVAFWVATFWRWEGNVSQAMLDSMPETPKSIGQNHRHGEVKKVIASQNRGEAKLFKHL